MKRITRVHSIEGLTAITFDLGEGFEIRVTCRDIADHFDTIRISVKSLDIVRIYNKSSYNRFHKVMAMEKDKALKLFKEMLDEVMCHYEFSENVIISAVEGFKHFETIKGIK